MLFAFISPPSSSRSSASKKRMVQVEVPTRNLFHEVWRYVLRSYLMYRRSKTVCIDDVGTSPMSPAMGWACKDLGRYNVHDSRIILSILAISPSMPHYGNPKRSHGVPKFGCDPHSSSMVSFDPSGACIDNVGVSPNAPKKDWLRKNGERNSAQTLS